MCLSKRARRAARKRNRKPIEIHGEGWTNERRARDLVAAGRAYFNESGGLELIVTSAAPSDGQKYAWYPAPSPRIGGVMVHKARKSIHASFR